MIHSLEEALEIIQKLISDNRRKGESTTLIVKDDACSPYRYAPPSRSNGSGSPAPAADCASPARQGGSGSPYRVRVMIQKITPV